MSSSYEYNLIEIAKVDSNICGIIAGFALAAIILTIEIIPSTKRKNKTFYTGMLINSITIFSITLYCSITASWQFSIISGSQISEIKIQSLFFNAEYSFGVSIMLILFGIKYLFYQIKMLEILPDFLYL